MIIRDDTILVDYKLIFDAIREEGGKWQQVEAELDALFKSMQANQK